MDSLFPRLPQNAGTQLLQFKAGKVKMDLQPNGKHLVSADLKKGSISIVRTSDNVLHFRWVDRTTNSTVDDYLIFPNETTFTKVNTGKESDRVFILKWKTAVPSTNNSSSRSSTAPRYAMFWMQQQDKSVDDDNVKKVNEYLNQVAPPAPQNQLMQMLGLAPAAAPAPAPAAASILGDLDFGSLLAGVDLLPPVPAPAASGATITPPAPPRASTNLSTLLKSDVIIASGIFNDPAIRTRLLTFLPAESTNALTGTESEVTLLEDTIHSPQFQQALEVLGEALLDEGNYQSILSSFNLDPSPGMAKLVAGDPVGAFVDCVTEAARKKSAAAAPTTENAMEH